MYTEVVMDHFRNPRNVGSMENADGVGQVGNPKCGDIMKIYLKINDETIEDVKFETFGCGSAIASSSMATELPTWHHQISYRWSGCLRWSLTTRKAITRKSRSPNF